MKTCPNCNRTYTDQALSFCLHDGTPLTEVPTAPAYNPSAPTVQAPDSRYTNPPLGTSPPATPMVNQMRSAPQWSPMPGPPPARRSVWPWIIGIVAILGFMGFGVLILIFALAGMNSRNANANTSPPGANRNTNWNANANPGGSFRDDFRTEDWTAGTYTYGTAWYVNDEYHMHANKGGYIAMYAPSQKYQTENATVRVTMRSVDGSSPTAGYGLLIHSERAKQSKAIGNYAFLIRTGSTPAYQVVQNREGKPYPVVTWTTTPYLRGGSNPNQIEVVSRNGQLSFSVNGHQLTSFAGLPNALRGIAGFYTTDANEIAFDDLEIIR
jgi:hypothetical protein